MRAPRPIATFHHIFLIHRATVLAGTGGSFNSLALVLVTLGARSPITFLVVFFCFTFSFIAVELVPLGWMTIYVAIIILPATIVLLVAIIIVSIINVRITSGSSIDVHDWNRILK